MKTFFKTGPLLVALFVCSACLCYTSYAGAFKPVQKTLSGAQLTRAKQLFAEKCVKCHGADGRGQTTLGEMFDAPDFTDKSWWKEDVKDKRLIESVRNGKGGMPKFGKKLTGQQIELLVTYVRRFGK